MKDLNYDIEKIYETVIITIYDILYKAILIGIGDESTYVNHG